MQWEGVIDVTVKFAHREDSELHLSVPCTLTIAELKAQILKARPGAPGETLRLTCRGRELTDSDSAGSITGVVLCLLYDSSLAAHSSKRAPLEPAQQPDVDMLPPDWMDSVDPSAVLGWTFGILLTAATAWHIFSGEPCSQASLVMLGSMTVVYIVLFLPQLRTCLALSPVTDEQNWDFYDACGDRAGPSRYLPPRPEAPVRGPV